jgi:5-formaminoimidazole-4-carboxamide-1-beta-D-ribofuranosyl 5'-monophosphate synthetase
MTALEKTGIIMEAHQTTPKEELERQMLSYSVPKNEREWWACREIEELRKRIASVQRLLNIQGKNGNWNVDEYMLGLYNGLECALSSLEGRDVKYRTREDEDFKRYKKLKEL